MLFPSTVIFFRWHSWGLEDSLDLVDSTDPLEYLALREELDQKETKEQMDLWDLLDLLDKRAHLGRLDQKAHWDPQGKPDHMASHDFRDSKELTGYLEIMVIPANLDQRVIRVHKGTLDVLASWDRGESRSTLAREDNKGTRETKWKGERGIPGPTG